MELIRNCAECGMPFMTDAWRSRYCTPDCSAYALGIKPVVRRGTRPSPTPELISARNRARYAEMKSKIADYKKKFGCKDCGYNEHHVALQFDHVVPDKIIDVSKIRSMFEFHEEVKKCEVVCANCHMIRTYARHHIAKGISSVSE